MRHSAPSWTEVLASWAPSPVAAGCVLVATAGYLWLAVRASRTGWRAASWVLAMAVLVVSLDGPVGGYAEVLFWVHMVQHLLLIMVVPVLVLWARPLELLCSAPFGARVERALGGPAARWATGPMVGLAAYTAVVVLTHLTGFQQVSATNGWVRGVELALYLVTGWLYFLPLVGSERGPWELAYLLRFVVLLLGMGADTLTGVALMMTGRPLAPAYASTHPGWGPTALGDQQAAGAIMWFGGDLLMMLLMILVAVQWGRASGERQGLGGWLESARRRAVLGDTTEADIDDDQRALDAYNATLAALHDRRTPRR
ncbi:cytochrome c oxidase assembly protein [Pseudonocardia acaciae]|uniref:cytochrome c oxidase assembly protein n=1 Tax=Pseudonocardia acaciae TaxID=551276 RepID=UPI00146FDB7C|nr:cytochrome c oxidase assembly protein [Pseudonocardia acaciae]